MKSQTRMFEFEDLPLFSGTAQITAEDTVDIGPAVEQESLATCRLCLDTGQIGNGRCWCEKGQEK
jgi:hypothetical protein